MGPALGALCAAALLVGMLPGTAHAEALTPHVARPDAVTPHLAAAPPAPAPSPTAVAGDQPSVASGPATGDGPTPKPEPGTCKAGSGHVCPYFCPAGSGSSCGPPSEPGQPYAPDDPSPSPWTLGAKPHLCAGAHAVADMLNLTGALSKALDVSAADYALFLHLSGLGDVWAEAYGMLSRPECTNEVEN